MKSSSVLKKGADKLRKYVTNKVPLVGLLKYVTGFQKFKSREIVINVKYVTKFIKFDCLLKMFVILVIKTYEKSSQNVKILQFFLHGLTVGLRK